MAESEGSNQLGFHYDRDERLNRRRPREERLQGGIFRRNRSLVILLVDVLLIVILYLVLQFFVFGAEDRHTALGCRFVLRAVAFEDEVLVSLRITRRDQPPESAESTIVNAVFGLRGSDISQEDADLLPGEPDEPRYLRARLPAGKDPGPAVVRVRAGEEEFQLTAPVEME